MHVAMYEYFILVVADYIPGSATVMWKYVFDIYIFIYTRHYISGIFQSKVGPRSTLAEDIQVARKIYLSLQCKL